MLIVPFEKFVVWMVRFPLRDNSQPTPRHCVVDLSVLILLADASAHFEAMFGGDSQISAVEENVQIRPQRQSIVDVIRPCLRIRLDVRRLQNWECPLARHRTAATISVCNQNAKGSLSETG